MSSGTRRTTGEPGTSLSTITGRSTNSASAAWTWWGGPVNPPIFSRPPASPGAEIGVLSEISSAHPLPEPRRPSFLTFLSEIRLLPGERDAISLVRIHTVTRREVVARWEVDRVPYVHSFSVTENHAVVFASPYYVSVLKMVDTARALDSLKWRGDSPCMIYVVDLRSGQVHTLKTEAMFFMHHANAFELDDSRLVVDIAVYEDPSFINQMTLENLLDPNKRNGIDLAPQLKRYTLNITTKAVSIQTFHTKRDRFISRLEFPTINEDYRARNYCYVYGFVGKMDGKRLATNALVKKDLCGNGMDRYWSESYHYGSELWFVPNPAGTREDDGVLLSPVLNGTKGQSYLAVFDARSMKLMNVGYLPTYIPTTIHGRFFENI